ncbi:MAG: hypothetical protein IPJ39_22105 [Saprospiraceae bacterium]|nr:hypothetical protein [Saprospiraceae bacterium]
MWAKAGADSAKASTYPKECSEWRSLYKRAAAQKFIDSLKTAISSGSISFADAAKKQIVRIQAQQQGGDLGSFATMVLWYHNLMMLYLVAN